MYTFGNVVPSRPGPVGPPEVGWIFMGESVESPSADGVFSEVGDLSDMPLNLLIEGQSAQTDDAIDRVLDLEENGLLSVASFNASI